MSNYFICTRNIRGKGTDSYFGDEPGEATFLVVPEGTEEFTPRHKVVNEKNWLAKLLAGKDVKDILVYVHGYNMNIADVVSRHNILKDNLKKQGWNGELITFAWPSSTKPILYLEDRHDAKKVSMELVDKGLRFFAQQAQEGCSINIHVLAHSTGAFIVREAFCDAQSTDYARDSWTASQIVFIAGDVSSKSMEGREGDAVYKHCARFTNYFNNYDSILAISNVKRLGLENRAGRVGLPLGSPMKAVDVNCSAHYKAHEADYDTSIPKGVFKEHAWYFWDDTFMKDLVSTLKGEMDRNVIPTRELNIDDGELYLKV